MGHPFVRAEFFRQPVELDKRCQDIFQMLSPIVFKPAKFLLFGKGSVTVIVNVIQQPHVNHPLCLQEPVFAVRTDELQLIDRPCAELFVNILQIG